MTSLLVLSDLHLEQRPAWTLPAAMPPFDVAVFAGDVDGSPESAVRRLAAEPGLAGRPVVFVPGNHEYWDRRLDESLTAGRAACAGGPVILLDSDAVVILGVRFVGATLWTDYRLHGDAAAGVRAARRGMHDHRSIGIGPPRHGRRFQPEDAAQRHAGDRAFIAAELAKPFAGPTVVVTHHAPHPGSVAPRFAGDPLTPAFVSDLSDVLAAGAPALWVHGHVHHSCDYRAGVTRIVCNPKGYGPRRSGGPPENAAFDPRLVVEMGGLATGSGDAALQLRGPASTFRLTCWTVLRVRASGHCHLLGYRFPERLGRFSSPVVAYDRAAATATTSTGNRYLLIGDASANGLDDDLVLHWLALHDLARGDVEVIILDES